MTDPLKQYFVPEHAEKAASEIYDLLDELLEVFAKYETKDEIALYRAIDLIANIIKENNDAYL